MSSETERIVADIGDIKTAIREMRSEMNSHFRWMVGLFITTLLAVFSFSLAIFLKLPH